MACRGPVFWASRPQRKLSSNPCCRLPWGRSSHELAERCLSVGDLDGARQAAMTSLRLVGVCEQCYRLRMLAAADNPTEVRQIMAELMSLLERENGPSSTDDLISSELLELYDQLISPRTTLS